MHRKSNPKIPTPIEMGVILVVFQELLNVQSVDFKVQYSRNELEASSVYEVVENVNRSKGYPLDEKEVEDVVHFYLSEKQKE